LLPLSLGYAAGVKLRNRAFDLGVLPVEDIGVPVVSVGNIVLGGTGKTPMVEYIAAYCTGKGRTVGIVSRGYGRKTRGVVVVSEGGGVLVGADRGGDEAVQVAEKLKGSIVVVGERRVEAAKAAVARGADLIIADDGFQHRYLGRVLNIVMLDASHDLRKEDLLPAGRLREPVTSVERADVIVLSNADDSSSQPPWVEGLAGRTIPIIRSRYRHGNLHAAKDRAPFRGTVGEKVVAFSGIGNHARFLATVRQAGLEPCADVRFPDHHYFTEADEREILGLMGRCRVTTCVTTEKDVSRIPRGEDGAPDFLKGYALLYIPVVLEVLDGEEILQTKLDACMGRFPVERTEPHV
jgi:tetraacyldisaccharide 4'-kinase